MKRMCLRCLSLLLLTFLTTMAFAQKTVTGMVKDGSGETLPAVSIKVKGTQKTTSTNVDGKFSISVADGNVLMFSCIGYKPQEIIVNAATSSLTITLQPTTDNLEEVVVTALGIKRQARSLGYSAQEVKGSDVDIAAPVDIAQGLSGKVAGLMLNTSNGLANASSRIVIRGANSLTGNNQPLIVLDGAILDNAPTTQSNTTSSGDLATTSDWGNYLSFLNMDNVESISVLKGPNAAALYGARGANGVLLITSKKGVQKKGIGIDYGYTQNFTNAVRYMDVQNTYGGGLIAGLWTANPQLPKTKDGEYYLPTYDGGSAYSQGGSGIATYLGTIPGGLDYASVFSYPGPSMSWGPKLEGQMVRWWDGQLRPYSPQLDNRQSYFKQSIERTHNLAFSAGGEFGTVRVSVTRTDADAIVPNNGYKNTNFAVGSSLKISKVLNADINIGYNQNYRLNAPNIGDNTSWAKFMIYGMSREYQPLEQLYYKNPDGTKFNYPGAMPYKGYISELYWNNYEQNSTLNRDELISTIKLNAEITPWLNAFVRTSANLLASRFENINKVTSADRLQGGRYSEDIDKGKIFNTDLMLTAHKDDLFLKGFGASASVMGNIYSNKSRGLSGWNNGRFIVPDIYTLGNVRDDDRRNGASGVNERRYETQSQSLLGILNLSYKNYLFLNVTGRNDVNSTLSPKMNSTFYPSVDASVVFTDAFKIQSKILSYGQLRASYGKAANATGPYTLGVNYNVGSFGGATTNSIPGYLAPDSLGFQTTASLEIGTNLGFFNNRLNIDFSWYNRSSKNQILSADIAPSSGVSSVTFNSGELRNRGFDVIVKANIIKNKDFGWDAFVNGGKYNEMVVALAPGIRELRMGNIFGNVGAFMKVAAGEKFGAIYGTDFVLDKNGNRQLKNIVDGSGNVIGTQYVVSADPVDIGNASPSFTGGFGNTFRYKNFSIYALIDAKIGGDIYSMDHAVSMGAGLSPSTLTERNGGGLPFTYPDGTTANVGVIMEGFNVSDGVMNARVVNPIFKYAGTYIGWTHINMPRSLSVFENTWVKFREFSIAYKMPDALLKRIKAFQQLSVSLVGRNLFYLFTTLPDHLNPEAINGSGNAQGLQWSAMPNFRTFGLSVKAQF